MVKHLPTMQDTRVQSLGREELEKEQQPTPVLLPGKSHGQRSQVGYSQWGRKESDTTERLHFHFPCCIFCLLYNILTDFICVGLFLGFLLTVIDLCVYFTLIQYWFIIALQHSLKSGRVMLSGLFFLSRLLWLFKIFNDFLQILGLFLSCHEKCNLNFDRNCTESVDCYE